MTATMIRHILRVMRRRLGGGSVLFAAAALALPLQAIDDGDGLQILPGSRFEQGGIVRGQIPRGGRIWVDGHALRVDTEGRFIFGFHRDDPDSVTLTWRDADGRKSRRTFPVKQREYDVQRIDGLPQGMVTPPQAVLERIGREAAQVASARDHDTPSDVAANDFVWPTVGRISSVYGSQRILNDVPRQPHYGLDIAAPTGTPVVATAAGTVRLAERDLYYTGGTIIIDHGHGISSTYLHLSQLDVTEGATVAQGETIGRVGATGRVTGPHLCFRYNWMDKRLDPGLLLPERMPDAAGFGVQR